MDMNYASEHASAILQLWYPGARGGKDIADILFGEVSPSGKLPITLYRDLEGMPAFTDYSMEGRTYRFLKKSPLYPFGYGLTYGDTCVTDLRTKDKLDFQELSHKDTRVSVEITNKGNVETEDVIQIYVQVKGSENEVPNPKLAAFCRVSLKPGEQKSVEITIPSSAFATVNEKGEKCFDGNGAYIYAGFGQPDLRTRELTGKKGKSLIV